MLIIIDYNVGNVKSVCNAFRHIDCEVELSRNRRKIEKASGLVLPGVAAFGFAVNALGNLDSVIKDLALAGKPLFGICVGYQMLFEESCEYGTHRGLGLVSGKVIPVPPGRVVPHMGWNKVDMPADMALFAGLEQAKHFYFANSFYADVTDKSAKIAYTDYGFSMPVSIQKGSIFGTQFHPEKSGSQGLQVLRNFAKIVEEGGAG